MPKNRVFREAEIDAIVRTIREWPKDTISWDAVCKKVQPILGFVPSRQGMNQREPILRAFQAKKNHLRVFPKEASPMPSSLTIAARRIHLLNAEIAELKELNNRLLERLQTWQYNLYLQGVTEDSLNKPLPVIDREVDKSEAKKNDKRFN